VRCADDHGYSGMGARMVELAAQMPGLLGIESVLNFRGRRRHRVVWQDEASLLARRAHLSSTAPRKTAGSKRDWYEPYESRVAKVERSYSGPEAGR